MLTRLQAHLTAVCPCAIVRIISPGVGGFEPAPSATAEQQAAASAALAAFDWSEEAHAAWVTAQARTEAQAAWDKPDAQLWRAFVLVLLDELNTLRGQHGLPARTAAQLRTAVRNRIETGEAD